jgi:hypothetical protein
MLRIRKWYLGVLSIWLVTGLPIYLLSQGMFGGPDAFTLRAFWELLKPRLGSALGLYEWLTTTILILLPLLCLPWAFRRARPEPDLLVPGQVRRPSNRE